MKKRKPNPFKTDTFRLIFKTKRRFISLLLIVLIGVGFMMGLLSDPITLQDSVDAYYDKYNFQDIQLYSEYGFCDDDVKAIEKLESVDKVFASKFTDTFAYGPDGQIINTRILEKDRNVNNVQLIEGRMPEKDNECVIVSGVCDTSIYQIGKHIKLKDFDEDTGLKNNDFSIVGYVKCPEYMTIAIETSLINNTDLNIVMYVNNDNFTSEYYTSLFVSVKGSKDYDSFSIQYDELIDNCIKDIESLSLRQQNYLKSILISDYEQQIKDGQEELNRQKIEGKQKLDDAKKQLDEANILISTYEQKLDVLEMIVDEVSFSIDPYIDNSVDRHNRFKNFFKGYGIDIDYYYDKYLKDGFENSYSDLMDEYYGIKGQLKASRDEYNTGLDEYEAGVKEYEKQIKQAQIDLDKARQELEELPSGKWTILDRTDHSSAFTFINTCEQMKNIGRVLPFMFFLVAGLVCVTTMKRLIDEQRSQIGIFVALGFESKRIVGKYLLYALLASLIGGIPGVFIGDVLFTTVIYNAWKLYYVLPEMIFRVPIRYAILSVLSFTILMMVISGFVVNKQVNEIPAQLLRPKAPKNGSKILLEKISFIWDRLSFTSKITARNIFRYKSRFLMTLLGVAGCTGLLVIGFGVKDSIRDIINVQFSKIFTYDYSIVLDNNDHINENIEILNEDNNNELSMPFAQYNTKVYLDETDKYASVIVMNNEFANIAFDFRKTDRKTEIDLDSSGVIVSEKFCLNNNIHKGDYITIESQDGIKKDVLVKDICEMYFQHYIFIDADYYKSIFKNEAKENNIAVISDNPITLKADCDKLYDYVSLSDFSNLISRFEIMLKALDSIIYAIIITAGALAFVVIINLSQVNISEREREIATIKVLGFHDSEVNVYIFKEIIILSLLGSLLGLPLGIIEHHYVMSVINIDMIMYGMNIYAPSLIYSFLISMFFTIIVLFIMRRTLRKVNMVESLKTVE